MTVENDSWEGAFLAQKLDVLFLETIQANKRPEECSMPGVASKLLSSLVGLTGPKRRLKRDMELGYVSEENAPQKLGIYEKPRPQGELIAVYVEGSQDIPKALGLYKHIRMERPDLHFLFFTPTEELIDASSDGVDYVLAPYSTPETVSSFLEHWNPDALLWIAAKLDEAFVLKVLDCDFPMIWADASLDSDQPLRRRVRASQTKEILQRLVTISPKTQETLEELLSVGAPEGKLFKAGSLETQTPILGYDIEERDRIAAILHARPIWLAQSVDEDEVDQLIDAHTQVFRKSHRLLLVLSPSDKAKSNVIAKAFEEAGWSVSQSSKGQDPGQDVQIHVSDTLNARGLWMRLAPITFAGGTFSGATCLDPLEPASLGSVLVFGKRQSEFAKAYQELELAGAAICVEDANDLAEKLEGLLSPDIAAQVAMAAWEVATRGAETIDHLRDSLLDALDGVYGKGRI